jgi:hypothetical protein
VFFAHNRARRTSKRERRKDVRKEGSNKERIKEVEEDKKDTKR